MCKILQTTKILCNNLTTQKLKQCVQITNLACFMYFYLGYNSKNKLQTNTIQKYLLAVYHKKTEIKNHSFLFIN